MNLASLFIRDFAIVRRVELNLEDGLTVLTGETGAGKSILIDALDLVLGARAESDTIRRDADSAEVVAAFDLNTKETAQVWLQDNDLDGDDECVVRRLIYRDKPTKSFINSRPVTVQMLRALGEHLVDIHGQHEHQSLLRRDAQRQILDDYAGLGEQVGRLEDLFQQYRQLKNRFDSLSQESSDRQARIDLLRFQVQELEETEPKASEFRELEQEHARLAHANDLTEGMQSTSQALYDADEGALTQVLAECIQRLDGLAEFEPKLAEINTLLNEASINVDEAATQLHQLLDRVELDPQRLEWAQNRIGHLLDLARKHRCEPDQLPEVLGTLSTELGDIENADTNLERLQQELAATRAEYNELAKSISTRREATGTKLAQAITDQMQGLGMKGGNFEIHIEALDSSEPTGYGFDRIEFRVSTNPGQPMRPMSKVASGGELSRISLALQVVIAAVARVPTLIFDEVDVGIGGGVAEIVGQRLRDLGNTRQVLCITHLPQVAAQGNHHLQVLKREDDGVYIAIQTLAPTERVREIARMLGGIKITDQTLAHAEDMLEQVAV